MALPAGVNRILRRSIIYMTPGPIPILRRSNAAGADFTTYGNGWREDPLRYQHGDRIESLLNEGNVLAHVLGYDQREWHVLSSNTTLNTQDNAAIKPNVHYVCTGSMTTLAIDLLGATLLKPGDRIVITNMAAGTVTLTFTGGTFLSETSADGVSVALTVYKSLTFEVVYANTVTGDLVLLETGNSGAPTVTRAPDPPNSLTSPAQAATTVDLSWTSGASNGGSAITDHLVQFKLASASSWSTFSHSANPGTTITVTGLTTLTSYDFRVAPINANGTGGFSNVLTQSTS